MLRLWIDIKNSHEPAFFRPIIREFGDHDIYITSRQYAEVVGLLDKFKIKHSTIGGHYGGKSANKALGLIWRDMLLFLKAPDFDVNISHGSINSIHVSRMRRKKIISFSDNDMAPKVAKLFFGLVDYLITPSAIPIERLVEQGAKKDTIKQYHGFKEDIYVADYEKDLDFLNHLPFNNEFITIRPESLKAAYVSKNISSIVPNLLEEFSKENLNILYLPRYTEDRKYVSGYDNVYTPPNPLNGLDVCYYSKAILTGAGTFAREAACMGTPAVSFFPEKLLAVDQKMVNDGWIYHSREPKEIVDYVLNSKKRRVDISRSKNVQYEVLTIIKDILDNIEHKIR